MIALAQRGLRGVFMGAEALFNRAFGDRVNPLYHLGTIAFFLFWVVSVTGIVLYAFFDTSVDGAHRSVQQIAGFGWGTGNVLRTMHRHASDAMLLAMLLHLARHWAFDRHRGFRWFSWLTGIVLLWLVYIAGVNGYMLPWDRLAQYVTQTSFEWLDRLPGFGGTLSRNFIAPEQVSNRLFSLLVFIHIGVPLATLLLLWVHVQRVPRAATNPPRAIAVPLLATLVVLAAVMPVADTGAADLRSTSASLAFDWFLLAGFPLIHLWPPMALWGAVAGTTLLLVLLPWLPPRRRGAPLQLTLHPGPARVPAKSGESILDAGLRAGFALPFDCRSGGCGLCACTVLHGRFDPGPFQEAALSAAQRARGQALMCCAVPLEDLEIEIEGVATLEAGSASTQLPRAWEARVSAMQRLTPDLMLLTLTLPPGQQLDFVAGQYINILLDDGEKRAFSFANAPPQALAPPTTSGQQVELQVRRIPGGRFTGHVFEGMREGDTLRFEGPLGRFTLNDSARPILFVAGATGFAPVKSILEDAFRRGIARRLALYWGVRRREDFYMLELVERWQREHANFQFVPVLSEPDDAWTGRRGLVHEALLEDHPDLSGHEIYACGSVRMVQAAVPDFLAHGLGEQYCFSDAFVPQRQAGKAEADQEASVQV